MSVRSGESTETVMFRGNFFTVKQQEVTRSDGTVYTAEWVTRTDGVRILAREDTGRLLLTDEYRPELGRRDYRLPGGKVENGNTPLLAAMAELREETGFMASSWVPIANTQAFSMVRYSLYYFEARSLTLAPVEHDEGEDIEVCWFDLSDAVEMALDGRIGEDLSALQIIRLASKEERIQWSLC
jgi:8-oxo-dGTP pyrophosphatase MutT (NUDIX family)